MGAASGEIDSLDRGFAVTCLMGAWWRECLMDVWLRECLMGALRCVALVHCCANAPYDSPAHPSPLTLQPQPPLGKSSIALKIELQFHQVAELGGKLLDALLGGDFAV